MTFNIREHLKGHGHRLTPFSRRLDTFNLKSPYTPAALILIQIVSARLYTRLPHVASKSYQTPSSLLDPARRERDKKTNREGTTSSVEIYSQGSLKMTHIKATERHMAPFAEPLSVNSVQREQIYCFLIGHWQIGF